MKEIFEVRKQGIITTLVNSIPFFNQNDKRRVNLIIITDNDIIVEALDREGKNKKILIPVKGIVSKITLEKLFVQGEMLTVKYVDNLGRGKYCSWYPELIKDKDRERFVLALEKISLITSNMS